MVSIGIELNDQHYKNTPIEVRFLHNSRDMDTKNSVFPKDLNYTESIITFPNLDERENYFESEEKELKDYVKKMTKQKSKIKRHILESIISVSDDEEINHLPLKQQQMVLIEKTRKYIEHLENQGLKVYQFRVHFDEGHIDNNEEVKINRHIHIIHTNVLENGRCFTKSLYERNKGLRKLQDLISDTFEMKRGVRGSKNKHKNHHQFKREKRLETEEKIKDKIVIESLKMKYQELEKENEQLKIENKNLININNELRLENININNELNEFKNLLNGKDVEINKLKLSLNSLYKKNHQLEILYKQKELYKTVKEEITKTPTLSNEKKKEIHKINKQSYNNDYSGPSM